MENSGVCVQCSAGRCTTSFHVTCAMAAEVLFEAHHDKDPKKVFIYCKEHTEQKLKVRTEAYAMGWWISLFFYA